LASDVLSFLEKQVEAKCKKNFSQSIDFLVNSRC
jgi:hypothetical protein